MGLQRFKLHVANAVVNQRNASLDQMNTDELLELFELSPATPGSKSAGDSTQHGSVTGGSTDHLSQSAVQSMLSGVGELWGADQYAQEYDMDMFLQNIE